MSIKFEVTVSRVKSVDGLQQAVLVRQLQEQHYHQYMQQLLSSQVGVEPEPEEGDGDGEVDPPTLANGSLHHSQPDTEEDDDDGKEFIMCQKIDLKHVSVL